MMDGHDVPEFADIADRPDNGVCDYPGCEGDGYIERWSDDGFGVVTELCPKCGGFSLEGAAGASKFPTDMEP